MGGAKGRLVPVISGPTGVGKTAVVTALARLTSVEIVSADSRQIYRGLDIGTAKPTAEERAIARYHGIDLVEPGERYSAGRYAREARHWVAGIAARGRQPVVVGGTGFYVRALFEGLFTEPALDSTRRERLRRLVGSLPPGEAARWARRLDPGFRGGGSQRAARALEVALLAGRPLSVLQREAPPARHCLLPWHARLALPRVVLTQRIAARAQAMVAAGIVEEVRRLLAAGLAPSAPGLSGVGYREVMAHLSGALPREKLAPAIASATRRYARRQETWLRHQLPGTVAVLDATRPAAALALEVLAGYRAALGALKRSDSRTIGSSPDPGQEGGLCGSE